GVPDFEVPEGFSTEQRGVIEPWVGEEEDIAVEIAFSPRLAWWVDQSLGLEAKGMWNDWTVVELKVADDEGFVSWVLSFGEDAVVRSPERLRTAVVRRLRDAATGAPPK